jgi:pimeloyl-ACP methyl ester carboxylesterase
MMGFGKTPSLPDQDYSLNAQSDFLADTLKSMGKDNVHIVAGDFGGPVALCQLAKHNLRAKSLTLFNTWVQNPVKYPQIAKASKMVNTWLGRFLYLKMGFSTNVLAKQAFADKGLYAKLKKQLNSPFPDSKSREPLYKFAQELTGAKEVYQAANSFFNSYPKDKIKVLWGTGDKLLPEDMLLDWEKEFKVEKSEAGHFLGYEAPKWLARHIDRHIHKVVQHENGVRA